jgi:hypothetical protein
MGTKLGPLEVNVGKWEGDSGNAARRKGYCRRSEEMSPYNNCRPELRAVNMVIATDTARLAQQTYTAPQYNVELPHSVEMKKDLLF